MQVVLDPGHGGTKPVGGSSPNNAIGPTGLLEKTVTLEIAQLTCDVLVSIGVSCDLTRDSDVNLGLADRAHVARDGGADAFVSIHFNGSQNHDAQGTETWIHPRASAETRSLASLVQGGVLGATGYRDRGVKDAAFGVLNPADHAQKTAACLVEISFLDIASEEQRLRSASYKASVAQALAQSIYGWLIASGRIPTFSASLEALNRKPEFPEDGFEMLNGASGIGDPDLQSEVLLRIAESCREAGIFFAGDDLSLGQKVPNASETATCGAIAKKIKRTDPEFANLVENDNADIVFKDEEGTGADRMMTAKLKTGLDALAVTVAAEWAGYKLRVTEAWDEDNEHTGNSLHYEGRGADLTTSPVDASKLGRLGRLAVEAGLDWVWYENAAHVHVSVKK